MEPKAPSTVIFETALRGLRKGYALRRFLEVLTFALAAAFLLDISALATSWFLSWNIHVPFFFETVLVILLIKEGLRLRRFAFAHFMDRTFGLKDRVYSFYTFALPGMKVPLEIREAQATECLEIVDLPSIRSHLKPRIPRLLLILAPVFLWIVYSSLNMDYVPPGTVSRTAIKLISPQSREKHELASSNGLSSASEREKTAELSAVQDQAPGSGPHEAAGAESGSETAGTGDTAPSISEGKDDGKSDEAGQGSLGDQSGQESLDRPLVSQLETEQVTEPGEAYPRDWTDNTSPLIEDPSHLLNLLPIPEVDTAADMESLILKMAGQGLEKYPVRYREHINRYFEELTQWQNNRTTGSTRN